MDDKSSFTQAGHLKGETLSYNASADVSTVTLNSPENHQEIAVHKESFDENPTQNEPSTENPHVEGADVADVADTKDKTTSENLTGEEWRFTRRAQLVFATLATLSLMVALDGTSISVALPVGVFFLCSSSTPTEVMLMSTD